jgi:hypothetical protein
VLLLVEENYAPRLRALLEGDSHTVHQASDGLSAIALAATVQPHVVVIDFDLAMADDYAVARHVRRACRAAQLIALARRGSEAERQQMNAAGFAGFLLKPSDPSHLKRLVEQLTD